MDNDLDLIKQCSLGMHEAWDRFVDCYGGLIYGIIGNRCGNPDTRKELFVLSLRKLWEDGARRLQAWRGQSQFSTYLATVISRLCSDYFKGAYHGERRRSIPFKDDYPIKTSMVQDTARYLTHREEKQTVKRIIEHLPEEDELLLNLFYWQGLRYREISTLMGISVNKVGKRLFTVRQKLRNSLEEIGIEKISDILE